MRVPLSISHIPDRPKVPRRSLVLIASAGALDMGQLNQRQGTVLVWNYREAELAVYNATNANVCISD